MRHSRCNCCAASTPATDSLAHWRPPLRRRVERAVGDERNARVACVARRAARRTTRRHSIAHADNININCWCPVGEKIELYDWKTGNTVIYSYELKNK